MSKVTICAAICWGLLLCQSVAADEAPLQDRLLAEKGDALAEDARRKGDAARGAAIFHARTMACATCHSVGAATGSIGPDLTKLDRQMSDAALVEAVLEPSKTIAQGFATSLVQTVDGRVITGLLVEESAEKLVLRDAAQPDKLMAIATSEIEERIETRQSLMPAGQVNQLTQRQQFLDLVRYLIELRDGGAERARQLQPPPEPLAEAVPVPPAALRPSVQRGAILVENGRQPPRGVALGFVDGTALFDADRLELAALWFDGFVQSSPQNYFGLNWQRAGGPPEPGGVASALRFKLPGQEDWIDFEPATESDPNVGTRFEGYQIGPSSIRLNYRLLVGEIAVQVHEEVRVEKRPPWRGLVRCFSLTGLPAGAQVGLTLPAGEDAQAYSSAGEPVAWTPDLDACPLVGYRHGGAPWIARGASATGAAWESGARRLTSDAAKANAAVELCLETWKHLGPGGALNPSELVALTENSPERDAAFDRPMQPAQPLPEVAAADASHLKLRPAVNPRENVDEFPTIRAKFLRFVVSRVAGGAEPGLDELEVYGADPQLNLALRAKASASSVISGYAIHQIPHLNDGKLGNEHSWISAERGGGWAQLEFPEPVEINKLVWARDRTGKCRDRLASSYRLEVSDDGEHWSKVGDESGRAASAAEVGAIRRDAAPGYTMEAIPLPFPTCRPSDIAFSDDGAMYVLAMTEGQVWRTRTPPVDRPDQVNWQRYAVGLNHPIGLAIVDGRVYVAQKPEITELIDRDGDGVVDHYRTVAAGWGLSPSWHEYCFGLGVDAQKNLYFALNTGNFWTHPGLVHPGRWRGSILRVTHGAERLEEVAKGCRVPNGIAPGPNGELFFTDNQGDWIQACKLAQIVPGRFYGHPETKADALAKEAFPNGRSAIWMPYQASRSTSGPVCDTTGGKFGPFADQMFLGDVGYGANPGLMRVALEKVKGEYQGACFRFVNGQPLGCERLKFGPDHQLYAASLSSGLTRLAYSGQLPFAIQAVRIRPAGRGFVIDFTRPLASQASPAPAQVQVRRYHYLYSGAYGSPKIDERPIPVESAVLAADRKSLEISLPIETHPLGMVYELRLDGLVSEAGDPLVSNEAWYTVHQIPD